VQLPPLSVLTLCILLSVLTVGFLLVALVFVRAIFGDILSSGSRRRRVGPEALWLGVLKNKERDKKEELWF